MMCKNYDYDDVFCEKTTSSYDRHRYDDVLFLTKQSSLLVVFYAVKIYIHENSVFNKKRSHPWTENNED